MHIYIHIPFCKKKCKYCDFCSFDNKESLISSYFASLKKEISQFHTDEKIESVFIGGGTPSFVESYYIEQIMELLHKKFIFDENCEISQEINPGTMDKEKATVYKRCGINRISIGVESFDDEVLKTIGRIHNREEAIKAVECAHTITKNINLDIMFSLPRQTKESLEDTLTMALRLNPKHISAYSLILEQGTPLYSLYQNNIYTTDDDADRKNYHHIRQVLNKNGYSQYEISNFAKKGYACRHNQNTWSLGEYKGFGVAAASFINGKRQKNTQNLENYIQSVNNGEVKKEEDFTPTLTQNKEDYIMLRLRTSEGIHFKDYFKLFKEDFNFKFHNTIQELEEEKLIIKTPSAIHLSSKGLDLANDVILSFWDN